MKVIEITGPDVPGVRPFFHLTEAGLRNDPASGGLFIAESLQVISIALRAGYEPVSFLAEGNRLAGIRDLLSGSAYDVPVYTGPRDTIGALTGYNLTRGVLCCMKRKPVMSPEDMLPVCKRVAVLEDITDTTNLGAIFRSAAALGMDGIVLTEGCCDPYCRRAVRVSMGTVFQVPWTRAGDDWPDTLHKQGFLTFAMALDEHAVDIRDSRFHSAQRTAVILGTEGTGLKESTVQSADCTVMIPMFSGVNSLNVAAAAAVAFWEMNRSHLQ